MAKEQTIGKVSLGGGPTDYIEVKIKVDDNSVAPGSRTSLYVILKNLLGGPLGTINLKPEIIGGGGTPPTVTPTSYNTINLEQGETESVEFFLENPAAAAANVTCQISANVFGVTLPGRNDDPNHWPQAADTVTPMNIP